MQRMKSHVKFNTRTSQQLKLHLAMSDYVSSKIVAKYDMST